MNFDELVGYRPALERRLRAEYRSERRAAGPRFRTYVDALEEFTLRGGKRFRALLLLAGYWIASGRDPTVALPAAAALEQFQSWMLIHDDIIDHAATRRGGPAVHRTFESAAGPDALPAARAAFGEAIGITLGDLEEPLTVGALLATPGPPERRLAALAEYVRMTRATAYGQLLDIANGVRPIEEVTESDVLTVHRLKSAIYTVAAPLRLGAIFGGGRPPLLADLESIGVDAGIAFQLRDDVLGSGFDAGAAGKSANDIAEGKRTLLVIRAWARASPAERAVLVRAVGRADATDDEVEAARGVMRATGALDYSEQRIRRLTGGVLRRIDRSRAIRAAARPLLREITDRLVVRAS